jgi:hypothetical protein
MPKRPKITPQPPEVGEIWQDCYDFGDERQYLILELDSETEITFDTRMYRVLSLVTGEICYRNMADWLTSWLRLA